MATHTLPARPARGRDPVRRPPCGRRRGRTLIASPSCWTAVRETAARLRRARAGPGRPGRRLGAQRVALGGRRAGRVVRRRHAGPAQHPLHRPRGRRRARRASAPRLVVVADGFLDRQPDRRAGGRRRARPESTCPCSRPVATERDAVVDAAGRATWPPRSTSTRAADAVAPDDVADILFTSGTTGPQQGRDVRAPADRRGRPRLGRARRGDGRGPLPRGQPVLPLLRLQGRDRRQPADRRDGRARWRSSTRPR